MKILTLNTWQERGPWKERWELTFKELVKSQPEIVGFQEVFNPEWAKVVQKRAGYPHLVFHPEHSGLMFLSKFPVLESACLTMKTKSPTEEYLRYALYARLQIDGHELTVFNTHLSWQLDDGPVREAQVGELIDFMDEKAGALETAVMGDFNAPPETPEIRRMIRAGRFLETYAKVNPLSASLTWDNRNPYVQSASHELPDRRIDYLFIRNQRNVLKNISAAEILLTEHENGVYASDHYAVMTTFAESK